MPACCMPHPAHVDDVPVCQSLATARSVVRSPWLPTVLALVAVAASSAVLDAPVAITGLSRIRGAALLLDAVLADLQRACNGGEGAPSTWFPLAFLRWAGRGAAA